MEISGKEIKDVWGMKTFASQHPKILEGFDEFASQESVGGPLAGANHLATNAIYIGGDTEFLFTNYPIRHQRQDIDVQFWVRVPDIKIIIEHADEPAIKLLPSLIDEISKASADFRAEYKTKSGVDIETRAMQHNAFKIKEFLDAGGNIDYIPHVHLMPDLGVLTNT